LLSAFTTEARKQAMLRGQKKVIRAHYENGHLLLKEDFVRLPYDVQMPASYEASRPAYDGQLPELIYSYMKSVPGEMTGIESSGRAKIRQLLCDIVQIYALQFKIIDNLLGILKSELCITETKSGNQANSGSDICC
jgi:hypothetical protein